MCTRIFEQVKLNTGIAVGLHHLNFKRLRYGFSSQYLPDCDILNCLVAMSDMSRHSFSSDTIGQKLDYTLIKGTIRYNGCTVGGAMTKVSTVISKKSLKGYKPSGERSMWTYAGLLGYKGLVRLKVATQMLLYKGEVSYTPFRSEEHTDPRVRYKSWLLRWDFLSHLKEWGIHSEDEPEYRILSKVASSFAWGKFLESQDLLEDADVQDFFIKAFTEVILEWCDEEDVRKQQKQIQLNAEAEVDKFNKEIRKLELLAHSEVFTQ